MFNMSICVHIYIYICGIIYVTLSYLLKILEVFTWTLRVWYNVGPFHYAGGCVSVAPWLHLTNACPGLKALKS